jgi:hypothetical protein
VYFPLHLFFYFIENLFVVKYCTILKTTICPWPGYKMIVLSQNCHRLANFTKKLAIKCIIDLHSPSILLLQETMIVGSKAIDSFTKSFLDWDFLALDAIGKLGGILSGWRKSSPKLFNSWASPSVPGTLFSPKN